MQNLFKKGRLGIRICLVLGLKYELKVALHISDIALQSFGEKKEVQDLCEKLVKQGLLVRDKDAAKSYRLAFEPEQIQLGNIIKICEDDLKLSDCIYAPSCPVNFTCFFDNMFWGALLENLFTLANQVTLKQFLDNMTQQSYVAPVNCPLTELCDD